MANGYYHFHLLIISSSVANIEKKGLVFSATVTVYSRYINCIFLYLGTQDRVRDQIFKHVHLEVRPKYSATRRILTRFSLFVVRCVLPCLVMSCLLYLIICQPVPRHLNRKLVLHVRCLFFASFVFLCQKSPSVWMVENSYT